MGKAAGGCLYTFAGFPTPMLTRFDDDDDDDEGDDDENGRSDRAVLGGAHRSGPKCKLGGRGCMFDRGGVLLWEVLLLLFWSDGPMVLEMKPEFALGVEEAIADSAEPMS